MPWRSFGCVGEYFWDRSGRKCARGEIVGGVVARDGSWGEEDEAIANDEPDERDGKEEEGDRLVNEEENGRSVVVE